MGLPFLICTVEQLIVLLRKYQPTRGLVYSLLKYVYMMSSVVSISNRHIDIVAFTYQYTPSMPNHCPMSDLLLPYHPRDLLIFQSEYRLWKTHSVLHIVGVCCYPLWGSEATFSSHRDCICTHKLVIYIIHCHVEPTLTLRNINDHCTTHTSYVPQWTGRVWSYLVSDSFNSMCYQYKERHLLQFKCAYGILQYLIAQSQQS